MSIFHERPIAIKGVLGQFSKIVEELDEVREALEQDNPMLVLTELVDLCGAIHHFLKKQYKLSLPDFMKFVMQMDEFREQLAKEEEDKVWTELHSTLSQSKINAYEEILEKHDLLNEAKLHHERCENGYYDDFSDWKTAPEADKDIDCSPEEEAAFNEKESK